MVDNVARGICALAQLQLKVPVRKRKRLLPAALLILTECSILLVFQETTTSSLEYVIKE